MCNWFKTHTHQNQRISASYASWTRRCVKHTFTTSQTETFVPIFLQMQFLPFAMPPSLFIRPKNHAQNCVKTISIVFVNFLINLNLCRSKRPFKSLSFSLCQFSSPWFAQSKKLILHQIIVRASILQFSFTACALFLRFFFAFAIDYKWVEIFGSETQRCLKCYAIHFTN